MRPRNLIKTADKDGIEKFCPTPNSQAHSLTFSLIRNIREKILKTILDTSPFFNSVCMSFKRIVVSFVHDRPFDFWPKKKVWIYIFV